MRRNPSFGLVVFVLVMFSAAFAQQALVTTVPNLIRYGGTLRDAQGGPPSSSALGVTFAIYGQQDGGAPIWMETQTVTLDAGGNYSVLLGSTTAAGLPADLFRQQEQRWLGVQVQGQEEQARVLLVSVPYAFKAHEADMLGGKSVSDFVLANGTNAANGSSTNQASSSSANSSSATSAGTRKGAASDGPTNFSGSTTNHIVGVTQSGTGDGLRATSISRGIVGTATGSSGTTFGVYGWVQGAGGIGVYGSASSMTGPSIGVKGTSVSPGGTGVRGIDIATTGPTTGVSSYVNSAAGTSAVFENAAGGQIISGRINGGHEIFSVDGSGNVNTAGSLNLAYGAYKSAGVIVLNAPANTNNTFVGGVAGLFNTTGDYDTFVGEEAGLFNTSGRNDLYIANQGPSSGTESNAIRIGTQGNGAGQQTAAYIAGIYGSSVGGSGIAVYVDNNGQLGTVVSSRRFKEQIADMGDSTSALMKLRPVTFLYKPEYSKGDRTLQYGLIAEEVAQVYPELVAYDNDGQPYTVRYQYLTPMLLNELQKEHAVVTAQQQELQTQLQQIKTQRQEIDGLKLQLQQQNASLHRKNASLEERLTKLESYVATQTRVQTASDVQPVATASPSGDSQ